MFYIYYKCFTYIINLLLKHYYEIVFSTLFHGYKNWGSESLRCWQIHGYNAFNEYDTASWTEICPGNSHYGQNENKNFKNKTIVSYTCGSVYLYKENVCIASPPEISLCSVVW